MLSAVLALDPTLLAALGAVGSAIIAALAYLLKLRHERKRTVRLTLFYLLQLRRRSILDEMLVAELPVAIIDAVDQALKKRGVDLSREQTQSIMTQARPVLETVAKRQSTLESQEIRGHLQKSLIDLARDAPILAYRLSSGLPSLASKDESEGVRASDFTNADAASFASAFSEVFQSSSLMQELKSARSSLTRLSVLAALESGLPTLLGCSIEFLRQSRAKPDKAFYQSLVEPSIDSLMNAIAQVKTSTSTGSN